MRRIYISFWVAIVVLCTTGFSGDTAQPLNRFALFEQRLERMRQDFGIPGMSGAIIFNDQIVWTRGFGYADLEREIPVTAETPFHVASITKTFAAAAVMQLVAQGKVQLDDPVAHYGVPLPPQVLVRHLLTHTSNGSVPGEYFAYDGNRYSYLDEVVRIASGLDLGTYLARHFLRPLYLQHTAYADGRGYVDGPRGIDFSAVYRQVAKPYTVSTQGQPVPGAYYGYFGASAGIISSAFDLAKYVVALDMGALVPREQLQQMWTPARNQKGEALPYGLGWFVQEYEGIKVVYHFGVWGGCSSLLLKVPERKLTCILLANNERLSSLFDFLGEQGVAASPFALAFLHTFVAGGGKVPPLAAFEPGDRLAAQLRKARTTPMLPFFRRELAMLAVGYQKAGYQAQAQEWFLAYHRWLSKPSLARIRREQQVLALIEEVGDNQQLKQAFVLDKPTRVGILTVGEGNADQSALLDKAQLFTARGKLLWQMRAEQTQPAGGAARNRMQFQWLDLPAGAYELRYTSDARHSWLRWQDMPPALDFYGAVVFARKDKAQQGSASLAPLVAE
ncbi:MAG: beta-lactamase family protein [Bacteroidetes bacterium]|nr:beta-lactamase family protein [Bacteroidota bacterium]